MKNEEEPGRAALEERLRQLLENRETYDHYAPAGPIGPIDFRELLGPSEEERST
jgi:hypothetical protein